MAARLAFVGQVARDLVLTVDTVPGAGATARVRRRLEQLGGKGASQAVAARRLGAVAALVGVVGDDEVADGLLRQATADGIDVAGVVRRPGASTGLVVDLVDGSGRWRYLEDLPEPVLLSAPDVERSASRLGAADAVVVQSQQPAEALVSAVHAAAEGGALVVVDGAPPPECRAEVLARADVLRADGQEAAILVDHALEGTADTTEAAAVLLRQGPSVVMVGAGGAGNVLAWPGGHRCYPAGGEQVVDTTGTGDVIAATLATRLAEGAGPEEAGRWAAAAAALSVQHAGGRPRHSRPQLEATLAQAGGPPPEPSSHAPATSSKERRRAE